MSNVIVFSLKCVIIPVCLSPGSLVDVSLRLGLCQSSLNSITFIYLSIHIFIYLCESVSVCVCHACAGAQYRTEEGIRPRELKLQVAVSHPITGVLET